MVMAILCKQAKFTWFGFEFEQGTTSLCEEKIYTIEEEFWQTCHLI